MELQLDALVAQELPERFPPLSDIPMRVVASSIWTSEKRRCYCQQTGADVLRSQSGPTAYFASTSIGAGRPTRSGRPTLNVFTTIGGRRPMMPRFTLTLNRCRASMAPLRKPKPRPGGCSGSMTYDAHFLPSATVPRQLRTLAGRASSRATTRQNCSCHQR